MVDSPGLKPGRKLFYGLFIFPLLIAVGMAVLLCTVVLLTKEVETPESLITAIKTGSPSKRWQKAFELSNELNQGRGLIRESGVMQEVIHILNDRLEYDAQTRSYMAMALSKFDAPEVIPALEMALTSETEKDVRLYLIWSLGIKNARSAVPLVLPYLKDDDESLRKMAAYVLGMIANPQDAESLLESLKDKSNDVRWNAALALARLGNHSGYDVLLKMADRKSLESERRISEANIEQIMVNAVKGLELLKEPGAQSTLKELAETDKSLKVREAAIQALKVYPPS